jgi:hypothetical protein
MNHHHHKPITQSAGHRGVKADHHTVLHCSLLAAARSNVKTLMNTVLTRVNSLSPHTLHLFHCINIHDSFCPLHFVAKDRNSCDQLKVYVNKGNQYHYTSERSKGVLHLLTTDAKRFMCIKIVPSVKWEHNKNRLWKISRWKAWVDYHLPCRLYKKCGTYHQHLYDLCIMGCFNFCKILE